MRPTSHYLGVLKTETFAGEDHLGGSTPPVIAALAKKPLKISLNPAQYPTQLLKVQTHLAKATAAHVDQISLVTGSTQACFQTLAAITDPGDSIIIEYPGYEPFLAAAQFLGLKILRFQRGEDLEKDFTELKSLAKNAKVLLISNPHCPTGWTYTTESLNKLAQLNLLVVIDEVFFPMFSEGVLSQRPSIPKNDNFIFLSGLSKSLGLGSARIGWVVASPAITKKIHGVGLHLHVNMPQPLLQVAAFAFKNWKPIIGALGKIADDNRQPIHGFAKRHPGLLSNPFQKEFFGMLQVPPEFADGMAFAAELLKHQILVRDGAYFEMPGHIRIHTLLPKRQFAKVFAKISSYY